ncbi:MAG: hypothetical protein WCI88_01685 [Chloroflexota bacterium]
MPETLTDYQHILIALEKKFEDAWGAGEIQESTDLENALRELKEWVGKGKPGTCPLDLARFGLSLTEENTDRTYDYTLTIDESFDEKTSSVGGLPVENKIDSDTTLDLIPVLTDESSTPVYDGEEEDPLEEDDTLDIKGVETPEHISLMRALSEARQHLNSGKLREVVALSNVILAQAGGEPSLTESAKDILDQATRQLNEKLTKSLIAGDKARSENKEDKARQHYNHVLELDPENDHARRALLELDRRLETTLSDAELAKLRGGLKERKHLSRLGEAVYSAEARDAEGTLPPDLVELLVSGRKVYDDLRVAHGEETTMMRFGNLEARKEARDKIRARVAAREEEFYDATTNVIKPAYEITKEADKLFEERSEETCQYEIDRINAILPGFPRGAQKRLKGALDKPFFEQHKRILEAKLVEVEKLITYQESAETYQEQAHQETDVYKILELVLKAYDTFPYIPGLSEQVERSRRTALETLTAEVKRRYEQADMDFKSAHFSSGEKKYALYQKARDEIALTANLLAKWPEENKPAELLTLVKEADQTLEKIKAEELLSHEFEGQVDLILKQVSDNATRASGVTLFNSVRANPRFAGFSSDLSELNGLMDQYRDIREQIEEAKDARKSIDWKRTYKVAKDIYDSGKAGQWLDEVEALYKEAEVELSIQDAQQYLEVDEIREANRILSKLLLTDTPDPQTRERLEKRLSNELTKIKKAIENNEIMQTVYDQAQGLVNSLVDEQRIMALRLFRYIGGDLSEPRRDGWPEYHLSLRTAEARRSARDLSKKLREGFFRPLEKAYKQRDSILLERDELANLAEKARYLRESNLLENEEERVVVRWAEMNWEMYRVKEKIENGAWEDAEQILKELNIHYPRQPEIENKLREARIQRLISKAQSLLAGGDTENVISLLSSDQVEDDLRNTPEISLALAQAFASRRDYVQAFDLLAQTGIRYPKALKSIEQKRCEIQALQAWNINSEESWDLDNKDSETWSINGPMDALGALKTALKEGAFENRENLLNLQKNYFDQASKHLLDIARTKQNAGTTEEKADAVIAILDLRRLEDIVEKPEAELMSSQRILVLKESFEDVAIKLVDSFNDLSEQYDLSLSITLSQTKQLHSRMEGLLNAARSYKINLNLDLQQSIRDVIIMRDKLTEVEIYLKQASDVKIWNKALQNGDFDQLNQLLKNVQRMDLDNILEIRHFKVKIEEWKEVHDDLTQHIISIKKLYKDGDFQQVLEKLGGVRNLQDQRKDGKPWRQVIENEDRHDFQHIRQIMEPRLSLADIYEDKSLVGWEEVENLANDHLKDQTAWNNWNENCIRLLTALSEAGNQADSLSKDSPLIIILNAWSFMKQQVETAINLLQTPPCREDGLPAGITSKQNKAWNDERIRRLKSVHESLGFVDTQIAQIQLEINRLGDYPTPKDFGDATTQKDWDRLRGLIDRARRIGSIDSKDNQRVEKYEILWRSNTQQQQKNKDNLFNRLFGRFINR